MSSSSSRIQLPAYLHRHAGGLLAEALDDTRVVVVIGARQVGKSTLVHAISRERTNVSERRLDRPNDLQAARSDPVRFVEHDGLLIIDEVQRAPELLLPIKARVDMDQRPGQYVLTGSARLLGLRNVPDALVGRTETIRLWPFSQGELEGNVEDWIDVVSPTGMQDYAPTDCRETTILNTQSAAAFRKRFEGKDAGAIVSLRPTSATSSIAMSLNLSISNVAMTYTGSYVSSPMQWRSPSSRRG